MGKLLEGLQEETRPAATPATPATPATQGIESSRVARVAGPHRSEKNTVKPCDAIGLRARCREACRGLPVSPARLLATLDEADTQAMLSGDPDELAALRAAAECMAERMRPELDAKIEKAYRWLREQLVKYPDRHRDSLTIDPDADPVLLAVAVRGIGCATLRIEKARYQGREFELIELWDRRPMPETAGTKEGEQCATF